MTQNSHRWIVVGGGASGMAAAYFLKRQGIESEIVESESILGGRIGSLKLGGRSLDCGGKNIGRRYRLFREFVSELGSHEFEHFGLNSSQVRNGKLVTFDGNRRWQTLFDIARETSLADLWRFGTLLRNVRSREESGYLGSAYSRALASRWDRLPVSRHFTPEFCRRIVRPMSVRMNGAEPDEIFLGNFPTNARMLFDTYEQLKDGSASVLDSFASEYRVRLNAHCESLLVEDGRVCGVMVRDGNGRCECLRGKGVILSTPAAVSAALTEPLSQVLGSQLRSVNYYPVALVLAAYDRPVFSAQVRSLVFDEDTALSNAGAYGIHDLNLVRYTFSGRTARERFGSSDLEALLETGEQALDRHIPVKRHRRVGWVGKHYALGLCAYTPYHARFLDALSRETHKTPGLHLTGDYLAGSSIEACFRAAKACVRNVAVAHEGAGVSPGTLSREEALV